MCWPLIFIGGFFILSGNSVYLYIGFMNQQHKIYFVNTISILSGGVIAACLANFSFFIGWTLTYSNTPPLKFQSFVAGVVLLLGPTISSFTGGYITARTGINKEKLIATLSGIIPLIVLLGGMDSDFGILLTHIHITLSLLLIIPCAWLGGHVYTKYKF